MGEKIVKLYTRQNDKTLYQLERDGRIINQRVYVELHFGDIAPLFMESYDWPFFTSLLQFSTAV